MKKINIVKKEKRGGCKIRSIVKAKKNELMKISQDKYFYLKDGRILKSLEELAEALKSMAVNIYEYHTNENKKDFANWVKDVFGNKKLATELRKARSARESLKALKKSK